MVRRALIILLGVTLATAIYASQATSNIPQRILLIPLDDRPAASHFATMIGEISGATIETPPANLLGRFTQPGSPEMLLDWLEKTGASQYDAIVVSMDMIAYGGLIASRVPRSSYNLAIQRIRRLWAIRKDAPNTRFYAFSAVMRLAPTATIESASYRLLIEKYAAMRSEYHMTSNAEILPALRSLQTKIPAHRLSDYDTTRDRNHRVQQELIRMTNMGVFDYLILGQDDAQPMGPHVPETIRLREMVSNLGIQSKTYFCEGIDQHSNVLISRALLAKSGWVPSVRIVFADDAGRTKIALYESDSVENSLRSQLIASGARQALPDESFDYSLYLNTPDPSDAAFADFVSSLKSEIDQDFPVAVADINLGKTGTGDPRLYEALMQNRRATKLLAYAGWNTAGNTMGTTIPAANVYLLARRYQVPAQIRETRQMKFLLHRLINDFEYHRYVRPEAYRMIDSSQAASREETYGPVFDQVNQLVRDEIKERLSKRFAQHILGTRFFVDGQPYQVESLSQVDVRLPWPRAYEVSIDFDLQSIPLGPGRFVHPIQPLGVDRTP